MTLVILGRFAPPIVCFGSSEQRCYLSFQPFASGVHPRNWSGQYIASSSLHSVSEDPGTFFQSRPILAICLWSAPAPSWPSSLHLLLALPPFGLIGTCASSNI